MNETVATPTPATSTPVIPTVTISAVTGALPMILAVVAVLWTLGGLFMGFYMYMDSLTDVYPAPGVTLGALMVCVRALAVGLSLWVVSDIVRNLRVIAKKLS